MKQNEEKQFMEVITNKETVRIQLQPFKYLSKILIRLLMFDWTEQGKLCI